VFLEIYYRLFGAKAKVDQVQSNHSPRMCFLSTIAMRKDTNAAVYKTRRWSERKKDVIITSIIWKYNGRAFYE
jgi:hypothetical protein